MGNIYYVYIHTNKINQKRYVGLTKQDPEKRWANGTHYTNSTHFKHAIEKYGWDNFDHVIYAKDLSAEEASKLEIELIKKYKTTDPDYGYNLDSGGSFTKHSEITKDRIRKRIKGIKRSDETKEKIRQASTGNKNCLGRKQTEESKRKNADAHRNKTHTVSEDARRKMSEHRNDKKPVICVELNKEFPSICAAARFVNGSQGTISSVLAGTKITAYGYHWKFKQ